MTNKSYDHRVTTEGEMIVPKKTFFNLPEEKREKILVEVMVEFRDYAYDVASINRIVERSGISKGSFYQYFEDKEDVYFYLLQIIGEKKLQYLGPTIATLTEIGFYEALRKIYEAGIKFGLENPDYLTIGNRMMRDGGTIVRRLQEKFGNQSDALFTMLLEKGIARGEIREGIEVPLVARLLMNMQMTVVEYFFEKHQEVGYSKEILSELNVFIEMVERGIR